MVQSEWDIQEVKRLKKVELLQYNLVMLLIIVLFGYFVKNGGTVSFLFGLCCVLFWIVVAMRFFTLKTGKMIGTKTSRCVQYFDRDRIGKKRWKRKTIIGNSYQFCKCCFYSILVCHGT
ncbi:hypothetical protein [Aquibacillus rhizosphaerae]|uniref:Uncharacterized protein n=1 Tax=Aquibacillus rhizosphaerae TaxID=3051431 RepID=A0ABT7L4X4_9BACI|nr:hypothetical protein [Aquibacillus sp. LR5S19]MDL4840232.1 hypothetical protein [Aquibacillus sp. LR5S19]